MLERPDTVAQGQQRRGHVLQMVRDPARDGGPFALSPRQLGLCGMRAGMAAFTTFVLLAMSGSVSALDLQASSRCSRACCTVALLPPAHARASVHDRLPCKGTKATMPAWLSIPQQILRFIAATDLLDAGNKVVCIGC